MRDDYTGNPSPRGRGASLYNARPFPPLTTSPQQKGHTVLALIPGEQIPVAWLVVGFVGEAIFGARFLVQWIATERRKRSVVPVGFWYLSLVGSVILLVYAVYRRDPVIIAGFSLNLFIYVRNLYFIRRTPPEERDSGGATASKS